MNGLDVGTILAIKGAKVSDYGGKSLNISNDCTIEMDPEDQPRYHELYKWYNGGGKTQEIQALTQIGEGGINASSLPYVQFDEMYKHVMADGEFLNGNIEGPRYYKCNGMITGINIQNGRTLFYNACVECKKKVNPAEQTAGWFCERCQKNFPDCNPTYNFSISIGDHTNGVYAQVLGESVGNLVFGMECKDLKVIAEDYQSENGENPRLKELIETITMQAATFIIRCKVDQYTMSSENEENRVRFYLSKFLPYDVQEENQSLLEKLKKYN